MSKTLVVHKNFKELTSQLEQAISDFDKNENYITKGERNIIKAFTINGTTFNIKRFKNPGIFNGVVYRFIRKSKAQRSFEYATRLETLGINTPSPVAYYENLAGSLKDSYYISLHLDYDLDFRVLNHNPKYPERDKILRQMATFTFNLHENNVNFLDHSPGNTLIRKLSESEYDFYLIDLNRMRFENMSFEKCMRNFRRLWLSKHMINIMAEQYARLSGDPVERIHQHITLYSRQFQKKINSKKIRKRKRNKLH